MVMVPFVEHIQDHVLSLLILAVLFLECVGREKDEKGNYFRSADLGSDQKHLG